MSFNNFIPDVWSAAIERDREKFNIAIKNCNRNIEGQIKEAGDTVRIQTVPRPTIKDYIKDTTVITPENLKGASTEMKITQSKHFSYEIDDIDKRQVKGDISAALQQETGAAIAELQDAYVFGKFADAPVEMQVSGASMTSATVFSVVLAALQRLWTNNVPETEPLAIEVSPAFYVKMILAKLLKETDNSKTMDTGRVGSFLNHPVYMSNNIYNDGTYDWCGIRTKKAVAFASQISKTEAYRPESSFSDAVKGLELYDVKLFRPKELVIIKFSAGAETTI